MQTIKFLVFSDILSNPHTVTIFLFPKSLIFSFMFGITKYKPFSAQQLKDVHKALFDFVERCLAWDSRSRLHLTFNKNQTMTSVIHASK